MNTRTEQKNRLQSILETITFNGNVLPVFVGLKTTNNVYPYCFITSSRLIPNKDGGTLRDRGTYERVREYTLVAVFQQNSEAIEDLNAIEVEIDELEQLLIDKIGDEATRNDGQEWVDIYVTDVSSPVNGIELNMDSSLITKIITVACETQEEYN